jgi:WD40 repeat protein
MPSNRINNMRTFLLSLVMFLLLVLILPISAQEPTHASVPITTKTVSDMARLAELRLPPLKKDYPKPFYWQVAFSPDGKQLAASTSEGIIIAYDPYSTMILWQTQPKQRTYPGSILTYDLRGEYLLVAGDYSFAVLKAATGEFVSSNKLDFKSDPGDYQSLSLGGFSSDSKHVLLMTGSENFYRVFDVSSGREIDRIDAQVACDSHVFLAGNTQVLCAFARYSSLRSTVDLSPVRELTDTLPPIDYISTSGDGSLLLTAGRTQESKWLDYNFTLHDSKTFAELKRIPRGAYGDDWPTMIPTNDGSLLVGIVSGRVKVLDTQTDDFAVSFPFPDRLDSIGRSFAFSPREDRFARILTDMSGVIEIYGVADCWATTDREVNRRTEPAADSALAGTWIPTDRIAIINSQTVEGDLWRQLEDQTWVRSDIVDVHGGKCS